MQNIIQHTLGLAYVNPEPTGKAPPSKRVRFSKPDWVNFYPVYAIDEIKYHDICEAFSNHTWYKLYKYPELDIKRLTKATRYDIKTLIEVSYVLENGQKKHLGDERHIHRYKTLNKVKELIANYIDYHFTEQTHESKYYTLYIEKYTDDYYTHQGTQYKGQNFTITEVEINNTWQLSIKQRLLIHLEALRLLRQGHSIEEACRLVSASIT